MRLWYSDKPNKKKGGSIVILWREVYVNIFHEKRERKVEKWKNIKKKIENEKNDKEKK